MAIWPTWGLRVCFQTGDRNRRRFTLVLSFPKSSGLDQLFFCRPWAEVSALVWDFGLVGKENLSFGNPSFQGRHYCPIENRLGNDLIAG